MQPKSLVLADTNVLARYLLKDQPEQFAQAERFIRQSPQRSIFLPDAVFLELSFVLLSYYRVPKVEVVKILGLLIRSTKFVLDYPLLSTTLDVFANHTISLVDSYIVAQYKTGPVQKVKTFDKKLFRVINAI